MISISLVRGQHESTKDPTQPPDTARWIWYKKTDSRTVQKDLVHSNIRQLDTTKIWNIYIQIFFDTDFKNQGRNTVQYFKTSTIELVTFVCKNVRKKIAPSEQQLFGVIKTNAKLGGG